MAQNKLNKTSQISTLLVRMLGGQLTETEKQQLNEWAAADPKNAEIRKRLLDERNRNRDIKSMNNFDSKTALERVTRRINQPFETDADAPNPRRGILTWYRVAAAAILLIALGIVLKLREHPQVKPSTIVAHTQPAAPANKVMLTLSNGKAIAVTELTKVNNANNILIPKIDSGALNYTLAQSKAGIELAYNTLSVPRGQQYQVVLPDGSRVWLNAETTLKYPVAFNGADRTVELSGEAYFEVAHRAQQPFRVKTNRQTVEVLGTHFNIQAYSDEDRTVTTLAQGSVKVSKAGDMAILKPGQMALNENSGTLLIVKTANLYEELGWKNGLLAFSNERIEDIMKEVARSYDITVDYQGDIKSKRFWGVYPRAKGLNNLLKNLEQTNTIHFKLQGRRVTVMP